MSKVKDKTWEIELTSDCTCTDEDGVVSNDCFGCWDESESMFYEALNDWRKEVGVDLNWIRVNGVGMGWQSKSGSAEVEFDKALKSLTINGDFRITAKWEGKTFTASRASHDEPTGSAKFKFTLIKERG